MAAAKKAKVPAVKEARVTNISMAREVFLVELKARAKGKWDKEERPNKAFRQNLLERFRTELEASEASAATLYNTLKKETEETDPNIGLGRDVVEAEPKTTKSKVAATKAEAAKTVAAARAAKVKASLKLKAIAARKTAKR